jgi:hypothetical protein
MILDVFIAVYFASMILSFGIVPIGFGAFGVGIANFVLK